MQQLILSKRDILAPVSIGVTNTRPWSSLHSLGYNTHNGESVTFIIFIGINYSLLRGLSHRYLSAAILVFEMGLC